MSGPVAYLEWSLNVECPSCGGEFDLARQDDIEWFSGNIFNNKWDKLKGSVVSCTGCCHEFAIGGVEY